MSNKYGTLVLVAKTKYPRRKVTEMLTIHPTPANATAWLRDNARKGGMKYTRYGMTLFVTGAKTTYTDPDRGTEQSPLFAPTHTLGKVYTDTSTKPQLD
jgi:hypothetical protein